MVRTGRCLVAALVLWSPALAAQDAVTATRVYVAYHQIGFGDLLEYIALYQEHSVPVLDELVEEGMITGYGAWMHNTGGEYNLRHSYLGTAETDYEAFWNQFLTRVAERDPAAFERVNRMIQAHDDEIWNLDQVNLPAGSTPRYYYDAQFQVNFADLEDWNRVWDETMGPALATAQENGLIIGWVEESHNTGGRFNWKAIMMVENWDTIDELQAEVFGAAPLDHPLWGMFTAHRDEIWEPLPDPSQN